MSEDKINPKHYKSHPSGVEAITIAEVLGFNLGNAFKYVFRAGQKGDEAEDVLKAVWYLERFVDRGHMMPLDGLTRDNIARVLRHTDLGTPLHRLIVNLFYSEFGSPLLAVEPHNARCAVTVLRRTYG